MPRCRCLTIAVGAASRPIPHLASWQVSPTRSSSIRRSCSSTSPHYTGRSLRWSRCVVTAGQEHPAASWHCQQPSTATQPHAEGRLAPGSTVVHPHQLDSTVVHPRPQQLGPSSSPADPSQPYRAGPHLPAAGAMGGAQHRQREGLRLFHAALGRHLLRFPAGVGRRRRAGLRPIERVAPRQDGPDAPVLVATAVAFEPLAAVDAPRGRVTHVLSRFRRI